MENIEQNNMPIIVKVQIDIHTFENVQFTLKNEEVKSYAGMIEERTLQFELKPQQKDFNKMKENLEFAHNIEAIINIMMSVNELSLKIKNWGEQDNSLFFVIAENA